MQLAKNRDVMVFLVTLAGVPGAHDQMTPCTITVGTYAPLLFAARLGIDNSSPTQLFFCIDCHSYGLQLCVRTLCSYMYAVAREKRK